MIINEDFFDDIDSKDITDVDVDEIEKELSIEDYDFHLSFCTFGKYHVDKVTRFVRNLFNACACIKEFTTNYTEWNKSYRVNVYYNLQTNCRLSQLYTFGKQIIQLCYRFSGFNDASIDIKSPIDTVRIYPSDHIYNYDFKLAGFFYIHGFINEYQKCIKNIDELFKDLKRICPQPGEYSICKSAVYNGNLSYTMWYFVPFYAKSDYGDYVVDAGFRTLYNLDEEEIERITKDLPANWGYIEETSLKKNGYVYMWKWITDKIYIFECKGRKVAGFVRYDFIKKQGLVR